MKYYRKTISFIIILILLFSIVQGESYDTIEERKYLIRNSYEIINDGSNAVYNLDIKVLAGSDSNSPYQKSLGLSIYPLPANFYTDEWRNTYGVINVKTLMPGEKVDVVIEKTILNSGIAYEESIYKINADYREFFKNPLNLKYIKPGEKIESDNPQIMAKASELAKTGTTVEKAKKIYDFVNLHIKYDTNPVYANKGALSGLINGRGVCDEYASLFTALCRAAGIPSRVVAGYWIEEDMRDNEWTDVVSERHAWSEFYLPGEGWIPAEPTFMYIYNGKQVPNEYYFANIRSGDRHFINNYVSSPIKSDIDVQYSYYDSRGTSLKLISGEESIKLLPEGDSSVSRMPLSDIGSNWAAFYIQKLYEAGIIFPREGNMYKPGENITRAEFAAYLANAIGLQKAEGSGRYKDVPYGNSYAGYIEAASMAGLIQGYNGYYYPENNITRQDAAVIMLRALKLLNKNREAYFMPYFNDRKAIADYAADAVKVMYDLNIMRGKPNNLFAPKDFTTRAEAAKMIWTLMEEIKRP
ncbi:S-layer homology domain-containing protein [Lutispora saccharofermentans]|uniref:S-layer homology domain-containing protein n=1 Tax=Lutispora saccharofermentans TaxID=3024236 RepID=A0ABT1NI57_9FIRM|nr:S-layer homology domain-containing protein [Lutispora saccharofermentans]MCQ1529986.1 S-layer homology domain-containing protein [Lutispora saccharofermentans]